MDSLLTQLIEAIRPDIREAVAVAVREAIGESEEFSRPQKLLSIPAVANILDVSSSSVRRLIASGNLVATKVGGQIRVRQQDLDTYVEKAQTTGA